MSEKKVGILCIGINGSIGTTLSAGLFAINKQFVEPYGLFTENPVFEKLGLIGLDRLVVGGWDLNTDSHFEAALRNKVVPEAMLRELQKEMEGVKVYASPAYEEGIRKALHPHAKDDLQSGGCRSVIARVQADIEHFRRSFYLDEIVLVNIASTERFATDRAIFGSLQDLERALDADSPDITSSILFAYAAISSNAPFVEFTPNVSVEIPALAEFAEKHKVPIAGKDGKTGQTLIKTVVAPMFKWRALKVSGWYSANILGNNDGAVLNIPENNKTKIESKKSVLNGILGYDDVDHQVHIHYYKPKGDGKEAWDNVDFVGWLNTRMSMRINWIGQDSALAAPLIVDMVRLILKALQSGAGGVQEHFAMFFKSPALVDDHDFYKQVQTLLSVYQ